MGRRRKPAWARDVHGILLLDKPLGISSNRALQRVKHLFQSAKAGHTGSLDPLASGMLPICLGEATKVSSHLLSAAKHYRVSARLGIQTSTGDAEGDRINEMPVPSLDESSLGAAIDSFTGEIDQIPPMYSALKHEGKRLYELARAGEEVERPPRRVTIYKIDLVRFDDANVTLDVSCSKGTYIRSLVEDIAHSMGSCGYVTELHRTGVDPFNGDTMITLDTLEQIGEGEGVIALDRLLKPVDEALTHWPAIELDPVQAQQIAQGQAVSWAAESVEPDWCRLYRGPGEFFGIGQYDGGYLVPRRMINLDS